MALAFVAGGSVSNATGSAVTSSLGTTVAGQLIVITIVDDSASATSITSVTDNKGNTYTKILPTDTGFTSGVGLNAASTQMWYAITTGFGTLHTVTVAWSTAATGRVTACAQYFNGFTQTPTLDKFKGAVGTATGATTGASPSTTVAAELVVVGAGHAAATSAFTLGAGYTNLTTQNVLNAASAQESKVVAATGAQTGAITIAASRAYGIIVATFYDGSTTQTLTAPFISSAALLLAMVLVMIIFNDFIVSGATLYVPTVTLGALTLNPPLIASSNTLYAGVVQPQPVSLSPPQIASGLSINSPSLSLALAMGTIASGAVVYAPTVIPGAITLSPPQISAEQMFTPNVTLGGVTLTNPFLVNVNQMFPPTVARQLNPNELLLLGVG